MAEGSNRVEVFELPPGEAIPEAVLQSSRPLLLKGLVSDWPLVQAAGQSDRSAMDYLLQFYQDKNVGMFSAPPGGDGRVFYSDDFTGFNYERFVINLAQLFDLLDEESRKDDPRMIYLGSTSVDSHLPGLRAENDLQGLEAFRPLMSIWLGNRTCVAPHFDVPDNIACCVAGRRRFTLFPPEQLKNLYIGPLEFNPGGQSISLVDPAEPDFERFPRYREALNHAEVAELEAGDALFVPSMWWHQVDGLEDFNVLINYWWRSTPAFMGSPAHTLEHAILTLRDLPEDERKAWQEIFRYYIFEFEPGTVEHIPEHVRGMLSRLDDKTARQIRARLLNRLNR